MSSHTPTESDSRQTSHRRRKRSNRSRFTLLWRAAGVVALLFIFTALWYWNRKVQPRGPSPLEDTSISRPG